MRDNSVAAAPQEQQQSMPAVPEVLPATSPDEATEVVPLPEVLRQIGRDSRKDPQQYLDETRVPLGGE